MKGIIRSKIAVSVLFAVCVGVFAAQANVLVYEGFSSSDYTAGESINGKKSGNKSVGLDTANGWNSGTAVFTAQSNGLPLPDAWTASGSAVHGTNDLRAVLYHTAANKTSRDNRAQQRQLTCTWPTSGSIYFRFLMQVPQTALSTSYLGSSCFWLAGLGTEVIQNPTSGGNTTTITKGFYMGVRNNNGTLEVAAYVKNPADGYTISRTLFTIDDTSKDLRCACIAKIDIGQNGDDAISFYAAPTNTLSTNFDWTFTTNGISLVSGSAKPSYLQMIGQYTVNSQCITFDEFIVTDNESEAYAHGAPTAPALGAVTLTRTGATYSISATEAANTADLYWIADNGYSTPVTNLIQSAVAADGTASGTISGLASNKTYQISVLAQNGSGVDQKVAGVIYTGELTLDSENATNAYEYQLQAGGVTVSRANADPWPLTVNYTITGSAGSEGTTWAAPVAVTIPANEASAMLPVVPLADGDVTSNITITVTLTDGNYDVPSANTATLTLVNLAPPAGKKTWTASANGNASDGANWTPAGAPTSTDEILFAGAFSNARCYWDAAATQTIASYTMDSEFTGVVEVQTTYDDGAFPVLNITGNCTINGGKITQIVNSNQQLYRISLSIGGNLVTATGTEITAQGKGFAKGYYPEGSAIGVHGGSVGDITKVYGDIKHPTECGSGGDSAGMAGGGAIHLVVTGSSTVDGKIIANPTWETKNNSYGAAGSIYIQTASLSGSGEISAAGWGNAGSTAKNDGAGGRVAIILTSANTLDFPKEKILTRGTIGGYGSTSGGGTLFVKTANQQNGTLVIVNELRNEFTYVQYWPTKRGVTPIPAGETWTLDALEFRGTGVLCVPEGATLNVPIANITATEARASGILYEGGTINFGSAPYTMSNKWVFQADVPYTFNGDVVVTNGASIGCLRFSGSILDGSNENGAKSDNYAVCDVTVNGNLTIASGGYASAEMGGPCGNAGTGGRGDSGGFYPRHGGQYAPQSGNHCYGSVFNPVLPGQFAQDGDHATIGVGGGALKLTVTGDLVVDGRVTADGVVRYKSSAPAGSVNIRANTLSGSGSISATGNKADAVGWGDPSYHGVGGRIAVRVTGEDVGTTGIWANIAARGCATNQVNTTNARNQNSSAGTIYLQGMSDGEKGGTIYVKNQASYDTSNVATWIPAAARGDGAKDFAKAKLVIADRGVVAVGTNRLAVASVSIATNSKVNLAGNVLTAKKAYLKGVSLAAGRYTAENPAVTGYVVDSVGGGKLIVGGGFSVVVR